MLTERVFSRPSSFALTTPCCPSQARSFSTNPPLLVLELPDALSPS